MATGRFYFPLEKERCCWPSEAQAELEQCLTQKPLRRAVLLTRIGELHLAESILLGRIQSEDLTEKILSADYLAGIHITKRNNERAQNLITLAESFLAKYRRQNKSTEYNKLHATIELRREQNDIDYISPVFKESIESPLRWQQQFQKKLFAGDGDGIVSDLNQWPETATSPEALELKSIALRALGRSEEAMEIIDRLLQRMKGSSTAWMQVLQLNDEAKRYNGLAVTMATKQHPRDPNIAHVRSAVQLMGRQTAAGRRSVFQERIQYSLQLENKHPGQSNGNLVNAYDQTGCSHLMPYLHQRIWDALEEQPLLCSNLVIQLASQTHPRCIEATKALIPNYQNSGTENLKRLVTHNGQLKVALVSPDFGYHPVGRFVQMLLEGGLGQHGELLLISTHGTCLPRTIELAGQNLIDMSDQTIEQRLTNLKRLKLDVAIDLAGWTANHNGPLFAHRIAPIQINYLGYFASNGLPEMDYWLGDQALFPTPMQEWHSETVTRLSRPFLAWNPSKYLPEGNVEVPPAPMGEIKFGCFNHVRKLSVETLSLWGKILEQLPAAKLALKAYATDDPGVVELLERRMRRCGIDPSRVTWIPTAARPIDHLRQYGLIDIGLDPFPNGGCTTTCEALWMGVPVITLRGSHYVGRMSSAVLAAANLQEYIANSHQEYLQLALKAHQDLRYHRENRSNLRQQLLKSPLGDNKGLALELWRCWHSLHQSLASNPLDDQR